MFSILAPYSVQDFQDFPGGALYRNLPTNAGVMGVIPGLERYHMTWTHVLQLLSSCSRVCKLQLASLHAAASKA